MQQKCEFQRQWELKLTSFWDFYLAREGAEPTGDLERVKASGLDPKGTEAGARMAEFHNSDL